MIAQVSHEGIYVDKEDRQSIQKTIKLLYEKLFDFDGPTVRANAAQFLVAIGFDAH